MSNGRKNEYAWHGFPVRIEFGTVTVKENTEKPFFWHNYECLGGDSPTGVATIQAIHIIHGQGSFILANHFGVGEQKVIRGGWPDFPHFSVEDSVFTEQPDAEHPIWDEKAYAEYEQNRREWFKENVAEKYPEVWARMEAAKAIASRSIIGRTYD